MKPLLQTLVTAIDRTNERIGKTVAWLTLAMVLLTFVIVVLRYVANTGWIAMQESVMYMHATVFLLAIAYTLQRDEHVRVDIFYRDMSPRRKALADAVGGVLFLIPVCGFLLYASWGYAADAWAVKEASGEAGGLPWVYLLKTLMPLMALLLLLQGIAQTVRSLYTVLNSPLDQG